MSTPPPPARGLARLVDAARGVGSLFKALANASDASDDAAPAPAPPAPNCEGVPNGWRCKLAGTTHEHCIVERVKPHEP